VLISIFLPQRIIAMCFNFFRLLLIQHRKGTIGFTRCAQKLIEFCVYRLRTCGGTPGMG
jgi:hypothetical protein